MPEPPIPDALRRFLLSGVLTVPHVEAILQLHSTPDELWDARRLAKRLYLRPDAVAALLVDLQELGIARCEQGGSESFRYFPTTVELTQLVEQLVASYTKHLSAVARLIHSVEDRKAKAFADAFRFKKGP